jgi:antitoxin component YwqK of YwqJK toxin-antitoxin module
MRTKEMNEEGKKRIHANYLSYELDGSWSYQDNPYTGIVYYTSPEDDPNGRVTAEVEFINGWKKHSKSWHKNGHLKKEVIFDSFDGAFVHRWHENGQLAEEETIEGGPVSRRKQWDEEGNLTENFVISPEHPQYKRVLQIRTIKEKKIE